jgi:hypothetical protein
MRKRTALLLIVALALPNAATAKQRILCKSPGNHDIEIILGETREFGRTLNCIWGDFIADITPCAPNHGFGLSAPTGSAALVDVVDRRRDYADHIGAVTGNIVSREKITFSGGFTFPKEDETINESRASIGLPPVPDGDIIPDGGGYRSIWTFSLDRKTGEAELKRKDKVSRTYTCRSS